MTFGSVMKGPPSFGHEVMDGERVEVDRVADLDDLLARALARPARWNVRELGDLRSQREEVTRVRRGAGADQLAERLRVNLEVVDSQRQRHPLARAVPVDEEGKARATHVLEEERRASGLHRPIGDGSDLEVRIDLTRNSREPPPLFERARECTSRTLMPP